MTGMLAPDAVTSATARRLQRLRLRVQTVGNRACAQAQHRTCESSYMHDIDKSLARAKRKIIKADAIWLSLMASFPVSVQQIIASRFSLRRSQGSVGWFVTYAVE